MVDRPDQATGVLGYLHIEGVGGRSARDMHQLLEAFENAYDAVARVELAAKRIAEGQEWLRRWGPPPRYWPGNILLTGHIEVSGPADPLIVTRVVLHSPGFWEFLGSLNPLEVLRRYLNDRHERRKDRDYRSAAERDRLAIENALASLDVVQRIAQLEREFGPEIHRSEAWRQGWIGEVRPDLQRLADFDERGMINGGSARAGTEPPEPRQLPPGADV